MEWQIFSSLTPILPLKIIRHLPLQTIQVSLQTWTSIYKLHQDVCHDKLVILYLTVVIGYAYKFPNPCVTAWCYVTTVWLTAVKLATVSPFLFTCVKPASSSVPYLRHYKYVLLISVLMHLQQKTACSVAVRPCAVLVSADSSMGFRWHPAAIMAREPAGAGNKPRQIHGPLEASHWASSC